MQTPKISNPFKPGAGHSPPYLAGRDAEKAEFRKLLAQTTILSNLILTGLRGVGKTVLLEELKPIAMKEKWLWVGTDLSEASTVNETTIVQRLLADLSVVTSAITVSEPASPKGFSLSPEVKNNNLNFAGLFSLYDGQPGLAADKLKAVLEVVWKCLSNFGVRGIVFAYDEAQTMSDHSREKQFPLSLLLDVFQSIQRKDIPFMLVLVGLPTLATKLVEARTYSERMFDIQILGKLSTKDSTEAIRKPIESAKCPVKFSPQTVDLIVGVSGGYPYFIQFICKELFDVFIQQVEVEGRATPVPIDGILKKLDKDFFAARWGRATDRQRQMLSIIARLSSCDDEFTVQEITTESRKTGHPFSASHTNQMLTALTNAGLVYKNRHGRYSFAVPLLGKFILRQELEDKQLKQMSLPLDAPPCNTKARHPE